MTISGFAAYIKQAWKNKPDTSTPLSADRLLHIEDGIKGNSDAIAKSAAAVINQIVNDPNKIASMAALYAVKQSVDQLNTDFVLQDLNNVKFMDRSTSMELMYYPTASTYYRLSISKTESNLDLIYNNGSTESRVWSSKDDFTSGSSIFGYTPGIGSYLNDDSYRPRWSRAGNTVIVYGVFAVGIAPTEDRTILSGFPSPATHTWVSAISMDNQQVFGLYFSMTGELRTSYLPEGNYKINFGYLAR